MSKTMDKYVQYGVPNDLAIKYEQLKLSVTNFRNLPLEHLYENYSIDRQEAKMVKRCIKRQPIALSIIDALLYNSNFLCCCCKGMKSDSYIIHHIEEYEISQNNSYENLVVLCPNDHDLAHRPAGLTNKITPEHLRESKRKWEEEVKVHNIISSQNGERTELILKIPKFKEISEEIIKLQSQLKDKETIIERSDAYFELEKHKLHERISELTAKIQGMEQQVVHTAQNILSSESSSLAFSEAVSFFLEGDIDHAIEAIQDEDIDQELKEIEEIERKGNLKLKENADARIFKAQLLMLNMNAAESLEVAAKGLSLYEKLAERDAGIYLPKLANCYEKVGSILYNQDLFDESESCFVSGINICRYLEEHGDFSLFSLHALLLQNVGASYYGRNDYETSVVILEEAQWRFNLIRERLNQDLSKYPDDLMTIDSQRAHVMINLGVSYKHLNPEDPRALDVLLKALKIYEELIKVELSSEQRRGYIILLNMLASLYWAKGDQDKVANFYSLALSQNRKLVLENSIFYAESLADLLLEIGAFYIGCSAPQTAEPYCDEAIELYRRLEASEKKQMQLSAALMYKCIIKLDRKETIENVDMLLNEVTALCEQYPENVDALAYNSFVKAIRKKK